MRKSTLKIVETSGDCGSWGRVVWPIIEGLLVEIQLHLNLSICPKARHITHIALYHCEGLLGGSGRGCWCRLAEVLPSVCPRAHVANHPQCVIVV